MPKFVYDQCPHDNTDLQGSDENTHRVYCLFFCRVTTEMRQAVYKEQKKVIYDATQCGEILLRDIVRESAAPDVPRDQVLHVVRSFSEVVQEHLRNVQSNGRVTSRERATMLEDAIQATVSAEDDGFQHVACMATRLNDDSDEEEGFPQSFENSPSPVCPTVHQDNDTKHVVIQQAKKTHHPIRATLAEACRTSSRDELIALAASSSSSGSATITRRTPKAPPPPPHDDDYYDEEGDISPSPTAEKVEAAWWDGAKHDVDGKRSGLSQSQLLSVTAAERDEKQGSQLRQLETHDSLN